MNIDQLHQNYDALPEFDPNIRINISNMESRCLQEGVIVPKEFAREEPQIDGNPSGQSPFPSGNLLLGLSGIGCGFDLLLEIQFGPESVLYINRRKRIGPTDS